MEMVSKQERQETVIQDFVSPQEEEMFRLDISRKTQEALKLMFDTGHFCLFPTFSLSPLHALKKKSFGVFVLVCRCSFTRSSTLGVVTAACQGLG